MYFCVYVYLCMYGNNLYSSSRGCQSYSWSSVEQGKYCCFPCPRSRLTVRSRETGSSVLSRISMLLFHTQAEIVARNNRGKIDHFFIMVVSPIDRFIRVVCVCMCVLFTLTDRASTITSNTSQGKAEPLCERIKGANREVSEGGADHWPRSFSFLRGP